MSRAPFSEMLSWCHFLWNTVIFFITTTFRIYFDQLTVFSCPQVRRFQPWQDGLFLLQRHLYSGLIVDVTTCFSITFALVGRRVLSKVWFYNLSLSLSLGNREEHKATQSQAFLSLPKSSNNCATAERYRFWKIWHLVTHYEWHLSFM